MIQAAARCTDHVRRRIVLAKSIKINRLCAEMVPVMMLPIWEGDPDARDRKKYITKFLE